MFELKFQKNNILSIDSKQSLLGLFPLIRIGIYKYNDLFIYLLLKTLNFKLSVFLYDFLREVFYE